MIDELLEFVDLETKEGGTKDGSSLDPHATRHNISALYSGKGENHRQGTGQQNECARTGNWDVKDFLGRRPRNAGFLKQQECGDQRSEEQALRR